MQWRRREADKFPFEQVGKRDGRANFKIGPDDLNPDRQARLRTPEGRHGGCEARSGGQLALNNLGIKVGVRFAVDPDLPVLDR